MKKVLFSLLAIFLVFLLSGAHANHNSDSGDLEAPPPIPPDFSCFPPSVRAVILLKRNTLLSVNPFVLSTGVERGVLVRIQGIEGRIVSIDSRPNTGASLLGISNEAGLYQINVTNGNATFLCNISDQIPGKPRKWAVDLDPISDNLKIIYKDKAYRLDINDCSVTEEDFFPDSHDDDNDDNNDDNNDDDNDDGKLIEISYDNNGTLFGVEKVHRDARLVQIQDDGTVTTIGELGIKKPGRTNGFDIFSSDNCSVALLFSKGDWSLVDLDTGVATDFWAESTSDFLHDITSDRIRVRDVTFVDFRTRLPVQPQDD